MYFPLQLILLFVNNNIMDICSNKENIINIANNVIKDNGYDYCVTLNYENCYFPAKTYGDITFPPGNYNAFNIRIGEHEGKNWCVSR